jgi:hypothetical protein
MKAVFLKTRSISVVDSGEKEIAQAYAHGIFGRELSTVEFDNLNTVFLDDFRRWREVLLRMCRRIVGRFREVSSNQ